MGVWGWVARNPGLYHALERFGSRLLRARAGKSGRIASLPGAGAWTSVRDIPAPDGPTFLEKFQAMRGEK